MKKWSISTPQKELISKLMIGCGVSSLTAATLVSRGYTSPEEVIDNMNIDALSDPFLIKDMEAAADTINNAIDEGLSICVFGDYDCDGIMATAILYSYLAEAGANVTSYIPERSEGYGMNKNAIDKLCDKGVNLIITVDNGISAISEAEYIYASGMKLVVTDHHQQGEALPRAEAVVDPHRHDCPSPFKYACGAVIALKLVAALDGGDYTMALEQFGDLAAIATVADIVNLTGENRFIVSYGMKLIDNSDRPALIALKNVCGLSDKQCDAQSIGFGLAPRINASGRFGSPRTALELFLSEDENRTTELAAELDRLNSERKEAENNIVTEINSMIENDPSLIRGRVIFLCGKNWHHGVIGIVASRIMEQYGKPTFIASEEDGEIRGSARSFGDFSVFSALTAATESLIKFGGHPGAGGFTIKPGQNDTFHRLIEQYAKETFADMPISELRADAPITPQELTIQNIEALSVLEPFGNGNEKPLFFMENVTISGISPLSGGQHSKLRIKFGTSNADALIFRKGPHELTVKTGDICDMIVTLGTNEYKGNVSVCIIVSDIRTHGFDQNKYFKALNSFEAFTRDETLPDNYYPWMLPSREAFTKIYKTIPEEGIPMDTLYLRVSEPRINYCCFRIAAEAFRQVGLIKISPVGSVIHKIKVTEKAQLDQAPVLVKLRKILDELTGKVRGGLK